MRDFALAIDSLDLSLTGMDAHGGIEGCRYSEVVDAKDLAKAKCQNNFEKGTKASARLEIRPLKGMDVSEIYRFYVNYDKSPGRTGITVGGFYFTHPLNPSDQGPLEVSQEDPFEGGKDFRRAVKAETELSMGTPVPYSDKPTQLLMRPQGWLYDSSPLADFDITKNTLMASGLVEEKTYTDLNIDPYQVPRRLDKFYDLFSKMDTCYPKRTGAKVVQPNFIHDLPPLLQWAAPETFDLDVSFRPKKISLGDLGSLELGDQGPNKIRVRGDRKKTVIEIELKDIKSLSLSQGEYGLAAKGLKVGKISLTLPPLAEIAKEMGWLDQKKAADVIAACLGQETFEAKVDHSPYLKKLFAKVELTDLHADSLEFSQKSRGVIGTLKGAEIQSLQLLDLKDLEFRSLKLDSLSLGDPLTEVQAVLDKGSVDKLTVRIGTSGPVVEATGIKGPLTRIQRKDGYFRIEEAQIPKLTLDLSQAERMEFKIEKATAKGSIDFKDDSGEWEFRSKGKSELALLKIEGKKIAGAWTDYQGEVRFSGSIEELVLDHAKTADFLLKDTVLGESRLNFSLRSDGQKLRPQFSLELAAESAKIENGHINFVDIGASSLEKGKIGLSLGDAGLSLSLEGKLDLGFPEVDIPPIEALIKGLHLVGTLKDIRISGGGLLELTPKEIQLTKREGYAGTTLSLAGNFTPLLIEDTPAERDPDFKKTLAGKVVQTEVHIDSAGIEIKDLEEFHFVKGNKDQGIKPELKRLRVSQFAITDIQAGGKIWAKFPLFGWLLGKFPQIGKILPDKAPVAMESEIRFESLETHLAADGRYTELKNFSFQLFEVGGRKQWAKFHLPLLEITPKNINTGKDPIELEVYFKDKDRGGDLKFELKDEDLTGRRRRKAP